MDSRIIKTRNNLYTALIQLLCTKNLNEISVKELASAAKINRTTFYLHYKNVYDVLDDLLNNVADGVLALGKKIGFKEIENNPLEFLLEIIKTNNDESMPKYGKYLLHSVQSGELLNKLKEKIVAIAKTELENDVYGATHENLYRMIMIVSGTIDSFGYWLKNGEEIPIEELARIISLQYGKKGE